MGGDGNGWRLAEERAEEEGEGERPAVGENCTGSMTQARTEAGVGVSKSPPPPFTSTSSAWEGKPSASRSFGG